MLKKKTIWIDSLHKNWLWESRGLVQTSLLRTGSFSGYRQGVDQWEDKREEEVLAVSNMLENKMSVRSRSRIAFEKGLNLGRSENKTKNPTRKGDKQNLKN